ncbi:MULTISPECIES: type II toxin-antitoxin system prevent-host-death family antitoxin [Brevibacterium]|uniref:type II toxin-antitoxin system prevent-host-death family antitoxin n=1 Tax=Brevibacterium TaxID=1696 RepID=UPI000F638196|nr:MULTISPECIES: type II toxin-antitoxin system prevent-host-death family antitoxin [Brevibacterium]AZL07663.1 prevent-host-death family protein [Brevibacterium aurantiacum]
MVSVTLSQFRNQQSNYIAAAQREPVEITSRGAGRCAVVVSPEFYDRALQALEEQSDTLDAQKARQEEKWIAHEELVREIGI